MYFLSFMFSVIIDHSAFLKFRGTFTYLLVNTKSFRKFKSFRKLCFLLVTSTCIFDNQNFISISILISKHKFFSRSTSRSCLCNTTSRKCIKKLRRRTLQNSLISIDAINVQVTALWMRKLTSETSGASWDLTRSWCCV